jgi:hypothetical protein
VSQKQFQFLKCHSLFFQPGRVATLVEERHVSKISKSTSLAKNEFITTNTANVQK